ncbi:MAG: Holliday junction resolvase RuvX [Myxococcota bacterium]
MKRLAIDYGKRRAGLAITDDTGNVIMPYKIIYYKDSESFIKQIKEILSQLQPAEIVMGLPLNMNGSESEMSKEVKRISKRIKKDSNIEIKLYDERLTTFEAQQMLTEQGISAKKQKEIIDMYAAYCILKGYINEELEKRND